MIPSLLLDTHVLVYWLGSLKRLSSDQVRILRRAVQRNERLAYSSVSLLELAAMRNRRFNASSLSLDEMFRDLSESSALELLPITIPVAIEASHLMSQLRDPADTVIVATARYHHMRLITSDQRIIESNLVATID